MSDQEQTSSSGCCSCAMFVVGGMILLGFFSFEPITMLVSIVLGGGLIACGYFWHQADKPEAQARSTENDPHGSDRMARGGGVQRSTGLAQTTRREHIPPAPRGVPQIEVVFDIDANGIIKVSAIDKATGKEQNIRIEASSGLSEEEVNRMKQEAEANAEADKKVKEEIDKLNAADALVFSTEKQLTEYGEKISADKKAPIEAGLEKLKKAHADKNFEDIDSASAELQAAWNAASEEMYASSQQGGDGQPASGGAEPNGNQNKQNGGDDVQDVDFEEVK